MAETLLIVDDEPAILTTLSNVLKDEGYDVITAEDGESAIKCIKDHLPSLILLDIWMPGLDGLDTLQRIKDSFPGVIVIMMSGHGSIETAVRSTKLGAYDYIEKPLSLDKIILIVKHALHEQKLEAENLSFRQSIEWRFALIGESLPMQTLKALIQTAGASNSRILILGENGTGKELVARAVHFQSPRRHRAFVEINCAAIPDPLIESELFGYDRGAFTGADTGKPGLFEEADGATLFLDEIADMSLATQAKVLRVLQEQRFHRVGGTRPIEVDVRIITASNKNLQDEIKKGRFREDLYYRLNVIPLKISPLRDRTEDIPLLAEHFFKGLSQEQGLQPKEITPEAMQVLLQYHWPGNIRELRNLIERLMILVKHNRISPDDLGLIIEGNILLSNNSTLHPFNQPTLREARSSFEREFIARKLMERHWNISKTAEELKIERTYLYRKIKQLGIEAPPENH